MAHQLQLNQSPMSIACQHSASLLDSNCLLLAEKAEQEVLAAACLAKLQQPAKPPPAAPTSWAIDARLYCSPRCTECARLTAFLRHEEQQQLHLEPCNPIPAMSDLEFRHIEE